MNLFEPYVPDDFDEFWNDTAGEAHAAPLDFHRDLAKNAYQDLVVQTLTFRGIGGETLHGWIAFPEGARRLKSFLWIPPYGRESLTPNPYGTREGFTSMSFNFHGLEAFHKEVYTPSRGYFAEGVESPETWIFRRMAQNALIAARVLQAQPEADEERIGSMGMSQGAGFSIWLGAWSPVIKAVCADMPFLGAMPSALSRNVYRYPLKELIDFSETIPMGMERIRYTISYFDTLNHATRCQVPTHVSLGIKDPACRPETVEAIYAALPGEKLLRKYDVGHDWLPDMVENNREWLTEKLR